MRFSTGSFTTHKHRRCYYVRTCTNRRHRGCSCGSCRPCCRRRRRRRCDSGRSWSSPGCGVTSCASSSSCDDAPRSDTADTPAASHLNTHPNVTSQHVKLFPRANDFHHSHNCICKNRQSMFSHSKWQISHFAANYVHTLLLIECIRIRYQIRKQK